MTIDQIRQWRDEAVTSMGQEGAPVLRARVIELANHILGPDNAPDTSAVLASELALRWKFEAQTNITPPEDGNRRIVQTVNALIEAREWIREMQAEKREDQSYSGARHDIIGNVAVQEWIDDARRRYGKTIPTTHVEAQAIDEQVIRLGEALLEARERIGQLDLSVRTEVKAPEVVHLVLTGEAHQGWASSIEGVYLRAQDAVEHRDAMVRGDLGKEYMLVTHPDDERVADWVTAEVHLLRPYFDAPPRRPRVRWVNGDESSERVIIEGDVIQLNTAHFPNELGLAAAGNGGKLRTVIAEAVVEAVMAAQEESGASLVERLKEAMAGTTILTVGEHPSDVVVQE